MFPFSVRGRAKVDSAIGPEATSQLERALNMPLFYGRTFYVCNATGYHGSDSGPGVSPNRPFATIDYAIGKCVADRGDRILVMPGHAENIATAAAIAADVAGVSIIGVGNGSLKPKLSFSGTAGTIAISAANVTFRGFRVTSTIDEVVKMFHVTAAFCTLDDIEHFETAACQTIQFLLTTNAADNLTILNCKHVQRTAAAATQIWIQLVGVNDAVIENNVFLLTLKNETASYLIGGTTACVDSFIHRNTIHQAGGNTQDSCVKFVTGSTGVGRENCAITGTGVATTTAFVGDAMGWFDNKWADTIGTTSGLLAPAVDTDD